MLEYFIDGNNIIGSVEKLKSLQKKDKQLSREKLVNMIENFFINKNVNVQLFFDGYENLKLNSAKIKIHYSQNKTADELIKTSISNYKNRKKIIVVSTDRGITNFAKVCSCTIISASEFEKMISKSKTNNEEVIIKNMESKADEFKKLFEASSE